MPAHCWINSKSAASILSVSTTTVRRWSLSGKLESTLTKGGHRRYWSANIEALNTQLESEKTKSDKKEILELEPFHPDSAELYNKINMANMILKLNLSSSKILNAIEDEMGRVSEVLSTTDEVASIAAGLTAQDRKVLDDYIGKVFFSLQYHDLFSQRVNSLRAVINNINTVLKLSLSDLDNEQEVEFSHEVRRANRRVPPGSVVGYIDCLLKKDDLVVDVLAGDLSAPVRSPEVF